MAHSSSMGKYGILHIVNRKNNSPAYSYPVDSEQTTFGRNDDCDIRLLYGWVSGLHCKLFFQNAKAFLTIYGLNGVIVDGCHIGRNPDADGEWSETTIPIMNNSQIEIYRKRFVFEYPSKELRIKAMAEPASVRPRRALRLSMIQSAQVFTPSKPPNNSTPKSHRRRRSETLAEQLQSPIKPFSPARPSPLTNMGRETLSAADEEREITLVGPAGAQSVVVLEEEKDLVVVEALGEESDEEDFSDEEEVIKDKENENPFDVRGSPIQEATKPSANSASPAPAIQRSLSANTPRTLASAYTPNRPALHRNAVSAPAPAPAPAPPAAPAPTPQPHRTPARKARFSLHKAVLLRSAQRQLIERERLNQLQAREFTIYDEDTDVEMADGEHDFVDEPESGPALDMGDANVDVRPASDVDRLTVQYSEADKEEAVEVVVSPQRPNAERAADGSFSDDSSHSSDQSVSEGDVSVESDISDLNVYEDSEHDQEVKDAPLGPRIRHSLSALGNFLPNLLRTPTENVATSDEAEEVDIVDQRGEAGGVSTVKAEPVDGNDDHEELHFPSDSEDEADEDNHSFDEHGWGEEDGQEPPSVTPTAFEPGPVQVGEIKAEDTPVRTRRLNAFTTPQVSRPNLSRLPAGRKSVALGAEGGAAGDASWLPSRVPVSSQDLDSEEEDHDVPEETATEDTQIASADVKKQMPQWDPEEKAARRQSALAVLAAGPRQLPTRRQSVALHLFKSEPIDPNDRRMTLAGTALEAPAETPQHASTLAKPSDYEVAIDSSDDEEAPPESTLDTLRKKVDYMRRQSMSRAAREMLIGPLFGDAASSDVKLEDSEDLAGSVEPEAVEAIKQELEEAEKELEELEDEAETEAELSVDEGEAVTDVEEDVSEHDVSEPEHCDAQEQSDVEDPEKQVTDSDHEKEERLPASVKAPAPLPTGPSTPALKGIRALFRAEEVKGLGTQTPAGLDGMLQLFGPEDEPEAETETIVESKPSRLRTKSANPTRSKIATATTMARAKSSQATTSKSTISSVSKAPEVARTRSTDARAKAEPAGAKSAGSAAKSATASRIAARTLREPTKLPSRVQTPTEDVEPTASNALARKATYDVVSVVIPRRTKTVKAEPEPEPEAKEDAAPAVSKLRARSKRITRTASASAASHTTDETKPITRTASSASVDDKPATRRGCAAGATTPVLSGDVKPAARSTRAKASSTTATRRKDTTSSARPTTPVAEAADDQDPMDVIHLPESPTKRSARARAAAVKSEPEDEESVPSTRSRTRTAESETSKGKRTTTKRITSKDIDDNKENAAVDVAEAETEPQVKPSALPTKTTRKTAPTASKLPAPTRTASKAEPPAATTTRALRTRARK